MTEQDQLISRMGQTLMSIHADKQNPEKDAAFWQDFAVACEREKAVRVGMVKEFDEALACGCLKDVIHRVSISTLLSEAKKEQRVSFWSGLFVGCVIVFVCQRMFS